jgi:hypothetical protein
MEEFMKYAIEMGSGAMIYKYIPSFRKIGSTIQKSMGEVKETYRLKSRF